MNSPLVYEQFGRDSLRDSMRLLHITDLHILSEPGSEIYGGDTFVALARVLRKAFALTPQPDCIVATGDLVEVAEAKAYSRLRELLLALDVPVYTLPGNHDSVPLMREHLLGGTIRSQPFVRMQGWGLALLNSQVLGESHGEIAASQAAAIQELLKANSTTYVFVALHHTPISPCPSPGCQLNEGAAFLDLLSRFPSVKAVIGGHAHLQAESHHGEIALFTAPSTCAQAWHAQAGASTDHNDFWASHRFDSSRHGFRIFDLEPSGDFKARTHWIERSGLSNSVRSPQSM